MPLPSDDEEVPDAAPESSTSTADQETLRKKADERDEFLNLLQRERADFINYRRQVDRDREAQARSALQEFVRSMLPVLDHLRLALQSAKPGQRAEDVLTGVDLVQRQMVQTLKGLGVTEIEVPGGARFDPTVHEAVAREERADADEGTVLDVVRSGWRIADRVLRPAQVRVAARPAAAGRKGGAGKADRGGEDG
jgi:molecular chaperone GrpE